MSLLMSLIFPLGLLVVVFVWNFLMAKGDIESARISLERQAKKHSGRFLGGFWPLMDPRIELSFGSEMVKIFLSPRTQKTPPRARIEWYPTYVKVPEVQIRNNGIVSRFVAGNERWLTGDRTFDDRFVLTAKDPSTARHLADKKVRRSMEFKALKEFSFTADPFIVKMSIVHEPDDSLELNDFVDLTYLLVERLIGDQKEMSLHRLDGTGE